MDYTVQHEVSVLKLTTFSWLQ